MQIFFQVIIIATVRQHHCGQTFTLHIFSFFRFDLMVNGGGAVTLQFRRDPFGLHERTVMVPWNEIVIVDRVVMNIDSAKALDHRPLACTDHDYDTMKPVVLATWKHGFQGGCPERSAVLAESQVGFNCDHVWPPV